VNKLLIAGQEGMVGQAIYKLLKKKNFNIIDCKRKYLDLTCQKEVNQWFEKYKPTTVINAAGRVGGILDNNSYQADYIYINTMIGFNLLNAALKYKVKKFINLGSACCYPKNTKQPIKEHYLLSSYLEKTNEGYALAKISTIKYCEYIRTFYKRDFISLQPANLYGTGDNFDLKSSHVIPALVRKFHIAKVNKKKIVEVWGSGLAKREFMNVNDLADAIFYCLKKRTNFSYANVSGPDYLSIKNLALIIKHIVGFKGKIFFNKKYPDGVKERRLDNQLLEKIGWHSRIKLKEGLKDYYSYFQTLNIR
jgi:GDP-L-fucose synthase